MNISFFLIASTASSRSFQSRFKDLLIIKASTFGRGFAIKQDLNSVVAFSLTVFFFGFRVNVGLSPSGSSSSGSFSSAVSFQAHIIRFSLIKDFDLDMKSTFEMLLPEHEKLICSWIF